MLQQSISLTIRKLVIEEVFLLAMGEADAELELSWFSLSSLLTWRKDEVEGLDKALMDFGTKGAEDTSATSMHST